MIALSLLCILPLIHIAAISFSSNLAASSGQVSLWPVDFTTDAYHFVLGKPDFLHSLAVTLKRVAIGVPINLLLTLLMAYPLSKEQRVFPWRTAYAWFVVFTMLFHGGLIPLYMTVRETGILNTIWALILPGAVPVFNVVLVLNFFRQLPKELEEAAFIDGAGHWTMLAKVFVPLSLPVLATITLFSTVGHWNAWFDGMIFMKSPEHYPLQTYLRTIIIKLDFTSLGSEDAIREAENISERTTRAAQIFLGSLPILLVYPFLQKYFMKGMVLGSVKG
ncbi:carbohydrate ABC transporter permease [Paenibacillus aurantius]|uniref:Carbohydrate ABC transporter permease n=2 Tax=Paenibacillus aurantius TaxID=2918900 RepID=A0AA96LI50_9BACL|nr:carbohydrate ABC transporter permease [Paenibacillus aurantius]WJH37521.1 carbohydrate ABC transporter permease [Paenibacillus sp. CC-CFT747]WNQ14256.1 carbohydrate ABC transporter permease [Paenibacillus aurantius]